MKVCLDVRVSTKGGTSTFIENYVHALHEVGHNHDIQLVFNEGAIPLSGPQPRAGAVPHRNRLLEFQWSQLGLRKALQRNGFDVYHSLKHVGPLSCPARTIYRVPAVGQFAGNYPMRPLDRFYWTHIAKHAYRRAERLIAVSDYVRNGLIEYVGIPPDRVVTIHNGVDPMFRRLGAVELRRQVWTSDGVTHPFILCVGNLVPVKNFATAINAYAILSGRDRDLPQMVIAGSQNTSHARDLARLVAHHHLEDQVRFVGFKPREDLVHLYNGAQMLVHPSLHEGFSFTILEAMACGVPIVATSTTSIPEAAGNAALYHHQPTNAEELAHCMGKVLHDTELAGHLSRTSLERAARFTWRACVRNSIAIYNELN